MDMLDPGEINAVFLSLVESGRALAGSYQEMGGQLLAILFAIMLSWQAFKIFVEDSVNQALANAISLIITTFPLAAAIMLWQSDVVPFFLDATNTLVEPLAGGNSPWQESFGRLAAALQQVNQSFGLDFQNADGWIESLILVVKSLATSLGKVLIWFVAIGVVVMAMGVYALMLFMGDVVMVVGLVLGPLLLPWTIIPATSGMLSTWSKFMVSGVLYKLVGATLAILSGGIISAIQSKAAAVGAAGSGSMNLSYLVMLLFWSVIMLFLMFKIPSLATGLAGGGASGMGPARMPSPRPAPSKPAEKK